MRIQHIKVYKFSELSAQAQNKVYLDFSDVNLMGDWWNFIYEDAENIGLKLTGFDQNYNTEGKLLISAPECAEKIKEDHGTGTHTYKIAADFLRFLDTLTGKYATIEDCPEEEIEQLENEFLGELLKAYGTSLREEYDYKISEEAIKETIEANEYEFTANGKQFVNPHTQGEETDLIIAIKAEEINGYTDTTQLQKNLAKWLNSHCYLRGTVDGTLSKESIPFGRTGKRIKPMR